MDAGHVDTDVVVVGGGPAGSAAAIACATRGLRVRLYERGTFAGDRPGETLHPGIEPLLTQLGVAGRVAPAVGARHPGIWIEWGGPRRFEAYGADERGPWRGYQVWRPDFDALLCARAREVGVTVCQPCAATAVLEHSGRIHGVATAAGPVTARIVVDATGRARWLCRQLGIASPPRSPRLIARYGYAQGACPVRDHAPALVGDAAGWTWTALVRPQTYQWTRLAFDGRQPASGWMPDEFRGLTPRGRARGADVTWRMAAQAAGPGWFIVGDAAALVDPTSSHGVLKAIVSGTMAGHLIAATLQGAAPPGATATAYHDWLAAWFAADATRLARFYRDLGVAGFA
jgi:flavin-dependent dehydrogenase